MASKTITFLRRVFSADRIGLRTGTSQDSEPNAFIEMMSVRPERFHYMAGRPR